MQLPPPVHGAALCNKNVIESAYIKAKFKTKINRINFNNTLEDMQRKSLFKLFKVIPLFLGLLKELIFFRPDVVYFTLSPLGSAFKRDVLFIALLKLFNRNIVYHLHGKGIANIRSQSLLFLYRFVFKNSTIICLTPTLAEDVAGVKGNANIEICPNGIEFNDSFRGIRKYDEKIKLLFLSNLLPLKGINVYLDAAATLIAAGVNIEVNIAGPFNDKFKQSTLDNILKNNALLADKLIYHGAVDGEIKWQLLAQSHLLVHPTFNDALPLVLIEALASGCLVISTMEGGIPDILEDKPFAFLMEKPDSDILSAMVEHLIQEHVFTKDLSNKAIAEFEKKYTLATFERRIAQILELHCE